MDNPQNPLAANKWVRIMCDYEADGVWSQGGGACAADDLPLDAGTVTMIRAWQAWYEHNDRSATSLGVDTGAHAAFGLFIAKLVKRALPDWTVIYHDESKAAEGRSREYFEYEITTADTLPPYMRIVSPPRSETPRMRCAISEALIRLARYLCKSQSGVTR